MSTEAKTNSRIIKRSEHLIPKLPKPSYSELEQQLTESQQEVERLRGALEEIANNEEDHNSNQVRLCCLFQHIAGAALKGESDGC